METNPYQTLGIDPKSTLTEARAAYLKHVRVLHPDRFDPVSQRVEWEMANQMLRDVNAAWEAIQSAKNPAANLAVRSQQSKPTTTAASPPVKSNHSTYCDDRPITYSSAKGDPNPFSDLAILSFGLVMLGLFLIFTGLSSLFFIAAIIFSFVAKFSIHKHRYRGRWLASFGLWGGSIGLIGLVVWSLFGFLYQSLHPAPPPPSPVVAVSSVDELNNELSQLDDQQQHEIDLCENNFPATLTILKVEVATLQSTIAEETKTLANLKQKLNSLKESPASGGSPDAVQKEESNLAAQISGTESELASNASAANEQSALLNKPEAEQVSQIEAQIRAKYDERRKAIKVKLAQLNGNP